METNELPEAIINQIDAEAAKVEEWSGFTQGAEFGYRLGLQACEEQLKDLKYLIAARDEKIAIDGLSLKQMDEEYEKIQEQLKAKDEEAGFALEIESQMQLRIEQDIAKIDSLTKENERLREALRKIQLEAIGVGDYAISPESHELIDSLLTKETCNHPATDKGPSGNIYCVVCLESLEILTETKPNEK